eukprot:CAMPEP_0194271146 /NCGR_PEP_ID=MMETSP0169-20130528/5008_1 /TAXON_ID=218684 /ORGANISM="Corethron pennatum, Strain L29A3" /LENGTH=104 /DNA_ID=CAMNT_0039013431 /DNA_START=285 /DNA_END=600 /DNA_ORIENTATION=-
MIAVPVSDECVDALKVLSSSQSDAGNSWQMVVEGVGAQAVMYSSSAWGQLEEWLDRDEEGIGAPPDRHGTDFYLNNEIQRTTMVVLEEKSCQHVISPLENHLSV